MCDGLKIKLNGEWYGLMVINFVCHSGGLCSNPAIAWNVLDDCKNEKNERFEENETTTWHLKNKTMMRHLKNELIMAASFWKSRD